MHESVYFHVVYVSPVMMVVKGKQLRHTVKI